MKAALPEQGNCSACHSPAERSPKGTGLWWHTGHICQWRNPNITHPADLKIAMFVPVSEVEE